MRIILVLICSLATAGTAAGAAGPADAAASAHPVAVVAAENVYGNIAEQIGGPFVSVTSILSDPNADPHLFEPGTRNGLAVSQARLVIQNGLGYDAFMSRLEDASPNSHRLVITISDVLGVHGADANPHLWYDIPQLGRVAGAITTGLTRADPAHAAAYRAGRVRFTASLRPLEQLIATIDKSFPAAPVAYTEPVPGYLLAAAGLSNLAPSAFTRAVEDGTEPTPQAVAAMDALIHGRKIKVLLYNSQTVTPVTERIRTEAQKAGIPVVGVTETLPPDRSFQQWQLAQARALYRALSK